MKKQIFSPIVSLFFVGSQLILMWYAFDFNDGESYQEKPQTRSVHSFDSCKNCGQHIKKALEVYAETWTKHDYEYEKFRLNLKTNVNGFDEALITQTNTKVGSILVYDGERTRTFNVTPQIFNLFPKISLYVPTAANYRDIFFIISQKPEHKVSDKRSVVTIPGASFLKQKMGHVCRRRNGGIMANSSCGKMINSVDFVIRCNLPPLTNGYEKDVGTKTDLVTANPTILLNKYESLTGRRRPLMEKLSSYGSSLLLLPAFSFGMNTAVCMRALYTLQDFQAAIQPVFINPDYLYKLSLFWHSQGLKEGRLSTGVMMASLALELCDNVHLYGFWPFGVHPYKLKNLTQHYYDDMKPSTSFHSMPSEFDKLLQLHKQGVLRLHLGDCERSTY